MTLRGFVLALVLLVPTVARAEPISVGGTWSSVSVTGSLTTEALALTPMVFVMWAERRLGRSYRKT